MALQQKGIFRLALSFLLVAVSVSPLLRAQSTGATFGDVIYLGGTPSDLVLDEMRQRLYLINSAAGRVDVWDYQAKQLLTSIKVGTTPLAGAVSMDNSTLYVSNNGNATLSVIDLNYNVVSNTVTLPAKPEGVAVGVDGRVLITTQGSGVNATQNTLLFFDPTQAAQNQVQPVQFPPPAPTPVGQPGVSVRPVAQFRGRLLRTPDGQFIVGLTVYNNGNSTYLFVYEVASGTILRSRAVGGQSSVLSMSPDGSKIMAGFTLYDVSTLAVIAQMSTANAPFPVSAFNTQQNFGGSAFSPAGDTLYAAFNSAPFSVPATRTQASTLFISDPGNLAMRLAIKVPESIVAKLVITSDGAEAWAMSESGLVHLPLGHLYDYPILQPSATQVFMANDPCNRGIAKVTVKINNLGKGKLTFNVPNTGAALISQVVSGVAPADVVLIMDPGRSGVTRQAGTNLYTGNGSNSGTAVNINIASAEAINIPDTIRVYMNYRQDDQRGLIYPVPVSLDNNYGLVDLMLDESRNAVYMLNAGLNRIEIFDLKKNRLVDPIPVGQLPRQMAMSTDGVTLYVANQGGELISMVDLDAKAVIGSVDFPPIPRAGNANVIAPRTLAYTTSGLMFVMTNGTQWKVIGNTAIARAPNDGVTPTTFAGAPNIQMMATPEGDKMITLDGSGRAYLYDALADVYTTARPLFSTPIMSYYGPLGASKKSNYFLANGLVLNSSLTVIGGAERPGTVQTTPSTAPGQPPTTTIVSAGQRNVADVAPVDENVFVRMTTPVRNNITATTRDDPRPTIELVDTRTGTETLIGVAAENPPFMVFGTSRVNVASRQMVVDSKGTTAYAITLAGLSVIPLTQSGSTATRPALPNGARSIVNSTDGSTNFKPGSFVTVNGQNLGKPATADTVPAPTVLGGSCVLFNDVALPLLRISDKQISAQIPDTVNSGQNVVTVRNLATSDESDPVVVTVGR
jgi:YVTN family beta-propeller protein